MDLINIEAPKKKKVWKQLVVQVNLMLITFILSHAIKSYMMY